MNLIFTPDIRLPPRSSVPSVASLTQVIGPEWDQEIRFEDNPWTVRAACLAHLIGA